LLNMVDSAINEAKAEPFTPYSAPDVQPSRVRII
jgi:hypothetical protein